MKARVLDTARALNRKGLSVARSGNVSARNGDGFFITPSAASYDAITEEDIAEVALDGEPRGGRRSPSSEWRFHADIYRTRPEVGAVVHAHSTCATALACLRRPIPPFHYMVAVAGGRDIRCAPYALFGSQELSDHAVTALAGRRACLLANHGQIAVGSDLEEALRLAEEVEELARQYLQALTVAEPVLLSREEMTAVLRRFETYR